MITITVDSREVDKSLHKLAKDLDPVGSKAIDKDSEKTLVQARLVHRFKSRTGNLLESLSSTKKTHGSEYTIGASYGVYIHDGTTRITRDPFLLSAIQFYLNSTTLSVARAFDKLIRKVGLQ